MSDRLSDGESLLRDAMNVAVPRQPGIAAGNDGCRDDRPSSGTGKMTSSASERRRRRRAEDAEYRKRVAEADRAYRAAHRAEINAWQRRQYAALSAAERRARYLRTTRKRVLAGYGLSFDEYRAMLARQGGACAICRKQAREALAVDHCHVTGKVRGLLCFRCNVMLGLCADNPDRLRAVTAYLTAARRGGELTCRTNAASGDMRKMRSIEND